MRRLIAFPCEGETLVGTLDEVPGDTGLLIVSGGNEVRAGAHRGMARLAAALAGHGFPVFRYDRRGVGDSTGENRGYAASGPDLIAAAACFRREAPTLRRVIGFGNCDAAAALALFGRQAGLEGAAFTNPWLGHSAGDLPPAPAIRARYLARLRSPGGWISLPDFRKLARGLRAIATKQPEPPLAALYARPTLPTTVILAQGDATALAYRAIVGGSFTFIRTSSHSFADTAAELEAAVLESIGRYSAA